MATRTREHAAMSRNRSTASSNSRTGKSTSAAGQRKKDESNGRSKDISSKIGRFFEKITEKFVGRTPYMRNFYSDLGTHGFKGFLKDITAIKRTNEIDYTFLTIVIGVVAAGLVILLSASAPRGNSMNGDSYYFFRKQLFFALVGIAAMLAISKVNYKRYSELILPITLIGIAALILVLVPGIGVKINGARRWLFGAIQPSELMKPVVAMVFAHLMAVRRIDVKRGWDLVIPVVFLIIISMLMFAEPHVSGAIIIIAIAAAILIAAGFPVVPVIILGIVVGTGVVVGVWLISPTRWARITSFINPFGDKQGNSYQIVQSIYAIGSGGLTGRGLGQSVQKFQYLPEPYNDFIFAIVCEELGLFGAIGVMLLFAVLILRGIRIALNAPDRFSMLLAMGIVAQIAIQTTINMGVATGTIPNTGASLPFFSYGGTSILTLLAEMGILLNISRYSRNKYKVF